MNFHAKSGLCSSRNERVMLNFAIWRPFCFSKSQNLFGLSIRTSMQNLDSVAQEMSELCSILWFGGHFVFQNFVKIFRTVHLNFHAKSGSISQIMSDLRHLYIIQPKLHFLYSRSLDNMQKEQNPIIWICTPAMSTVYLLYIPVYIFEICTHIYLIYKS